MQSRFTLSGPKSGKYRDRNLNDMNADAFVVLVNDAVADVATDAAVNEVASGLLDRNWFGCAVFMFSFPIFAC